MAGAKGFRGAAAAADTADSTFQSNIIIAAHVPDVHCPDVHCPDVHCHAYNIRSKSCQRLTDDVHEHDGDIIM
jgi:hypothetical protein